METAASMCNTNLEKETVKSYAQRQKEYRKRKTIKKKLQSAKKIPKTNAQRQQQFRQNQKKIQQSESLNSYLARKKKNAERAKRYRDKLKSKKQRAELDSSISSNEDSLQTVFIENKEKTGHCHDTNCEELIVSQFQMQRNQIQPSMNNEAQQINEESDGDTEGEEENWSPDITIKEEPDGDTEGEEGNWSPDITIKEEPDDDSVEEKGNSPSRNTAELGADQSIVGLKWALEEEEVKPPVTLFLQPEEYAEKDGKEEAEDPLAASDEIYHSVFGCEIETENREKKSTSSGEHYDTRNLSDEVTIELPTQSTRESNGNNQRPSSLPLQLTPTPLMVPMVQRTWTCAVCNTNLSSKLSLKQHMQIHSVEKPFECTVCSRKFARKEHLQRHSQFHTGERPYECLICKKNFARKDHLRSHLRNHFNKNIFMCGICLKNCSDESSLKNHMDTHSPSECCDTNSPRDEVSVNLQSGSHVDMQELSALSHQLIPQPLTCAVCNIIFPSKQSLKQHMKSHPVEKPFECTECSKKFARKEHLDRHIHLHTGEKPYECLICKKNFTRKDHLGRHLRNHINKSIFKCGICLKNCSDESSFKNHMNTHLPSEPFNTSNPSDEVTVELPSGSTTESHGDNQRSSLLPPQLTPQPHTVIQGTWTCTVCNTKLSSKLSLKQHMQSHPVENQFECTLCTNKFASEAHLQCHMQFHSVERRYECSLCLKKFARQEHLQRHILCHTGERPYECKICKKNFTRKDYLKYHIRFHQVNGHSNALSANDFEEKEDLKNHVVNHAGEKPFK